MYDLVSIGSITRDIFVPTDRGKIFKTPKDKLAPAWLGFESGEKICVDEIVETAGGVANGLSIGTKKLGLKSLALGPEKPAISIIPIDKKTGERVIFYQKSSGTIDLGKLDKIKSKWLSVSSLTGKWTKQAGQIATYIAKNNTSLILLPSTSQIRDDFSDLKRLLKIAKILILNRNEALEVASVTKIKTKNTKDLFAMLHNLGPKIVCITDGTKGAWASDGKNIAHSPILKVKCVDCTGAGDAFASGFLGVYLKGKSLEDSLKAGIINSASVVQYIGTMKGLLTRNEILLKIR
ncbi:MAG TPA: carbohydrate kinase family protein [Candidatus Bathyarchaeia archaeon]|nr:carbohydrate kinase family protein [Candidatus Bathyarchaeia archaeon]